ncbi:hypothetical protein [Kribbella sp. NPDC051137]|uniref:hypothetical protein n=1 Tax=Kribbella sp. NPDC051137 TaxID=3155045 RepID=UPI0034128DD6
MSGAEFLAQMAVSGLVAGVGVGSSAEQIRDALGERCVADRRKRSLRMDYGLLEFSLFGGICESFAAQVHRLASGGLVVPEPLKAAFVETSRTVSFVDLRVEVARKGASLEEGNSQSGYDSYRVEDSHVSIFVVNETSGNDFPAVGDIWSIVVSKAG